MVYSYKQFLLEYKKSDINTYFYQTDLEQARKILLNGFSQENTNYDNILPDGISLKPINRNINSIKGNNQIEVEITPLRIKTFNTFDNYKEYILQEKEINTLYKKIKDMKFHTLQKLNTIRNSSSDISKQKELIKNYKQKIIPLYKGIKSKIKDYFKKLGFDAINIEQGAWKDEPMERFVIFDKDNLIVKRIL